MSGVQEGRRELQRTRLIEQLAAGATVKTACERIHVSSRTGYRLLKDSDVRSALTTLRAEIAAGIRDRLLEHADRAIAVIAELLEAADPRVRLLAARDILDRLLPSKSLPEPPAPSSEKPSMRTDDLDSLLMEAAAAGVFHAVEQHAVFEEYEAALAEARQDENWDLIPADFWPHSDEASRLEEWRKHCFPSLAPLRLRLLRILSDRMTSPTATTSFVE